MKKKFLVIVSVVIATAVLLPACNLDNDDSRPDGVDFTNHTVNPSIRVRNNTGESLVAFWGELRTDSLIGGIPAFAQNHGLPRLTNVFTATDARPLILLTEAQFNTHRNNLESQRNYAFARVFVFYNHTGENLAVYEIDQQGGPNSLWVTNVSTSVNVELRRDGPAGQTIGFAPAGILETRISMQDGDVNIFPVFRRFNVQRDLLETVYPTGATGLPWFHSFAFGDEEGTQREGLLNLRELIQGLRFSSGTAWVQVNNQTTSGSIRFIQGTVPQTTATGIAGIATNRTFQIDMPSAPGSNVFADSVQVSGWSFGPPGHERPLHVSESDPTPVGTLTIYRDRLYVVTVVGDHNDGTIRAWLTDAGEIPTGQW